MSHVDTRGRATGGGNTRAKAPGRPCWEVLRGHGRVSKAGGGRSGPSLADFCKSLPFPWIAMRSTGGLVQEEAYYDLGILKDHSGN